LTKSAVSADTTTISSDVETIDVDDAEGVLTVKFRQPSHEFTLGVGMNFISYPLVLTPLV
jgi:hypothetical protein